MTSISYENRNLLVADVDALVNTVNTRGIMGKGVALQFKQAFPANYNDYRRACQKHEVRLGHMFVVKTGRLRPRLIINFPTKDHWRSGSRIADIDDGLVDLRSVIAKLGVESIAIPALGCGNGGLAWSDVRPLIEKHLGDLHDVRVLVFPPSRAPAASDPPVGTRRPRMTPGRAALVGLLDRYIGPGLGVTPLELQKLMYFLQTAGEPLRLRYVRAKYGPYAENLNHVLQAVEGHFLRGYGDRSQRVQDAEPIELIPGAVEQAQTFLADHPATRERFDRVAKLVEGFESPYGLELLATIHWVAMEEDTARTDPHAAENLVQAWSPRKANLFTPRHIHLAWQRLESLGWLGGPSTGA